MKKLDSTVVNFIRRYNPSLDIIPNPWTGEGLMIISRRPEMTAMRCVDRESGLYIASRVGYPVMYLPEIVNPDRRIIAALEDSRCREASDRARIRQRQLEQHNAGYDATMRRIEDESEEGYWHLRKALGSYNMSNISARDPGYETKAREDKIGKKAGWL